MCDAVAWQGAWGVGARGRGAGACVAGVGTVACGAVAWQGDGGGKGTFCLPHSACSMGCEAMLRSGKWDVGCGMWEMKGIRLSVAELTPA